jgi:hypothetical protein
VSLRRLATVIPPLALSAATLALGTAAAPDRAPSASSQRALQLVAKPGRIAPALLLAPGDRVQRLVELRARGRGHFAAVYLVVRVRRSSPLDIDRARGLQVELRSCSRRWRRHGASYACAGKTHVVLSRRPLVGRTKLKRLRLIPGRANHLRLQVTLPRRSPVALQGQRTAALYSFVGVRAKRR